MIISKWNQIKTYLLKKNFYHWLSLLLLLLILFVFLYLLVKQTEIFIAVVAVIVAVFEPRFHNLLMSPKLDIETEIKYRDIDLGGNSYRVCRLLVKNKGRSAAKNCKCYFVIRKTKDTTMQGDRIEEGHLKARVCWTVSAERPNATINKDDIEELDFCAFLKADVASSLNVPEAITPVENGFPETLEDLNKWTSLLKNSGVPLLINSHGEKVFTRSIDESEILVTASNAESVSKKIKINYDEKRIEFIN